jgi:hypothetical protein
MIGSLRSQWELTPEEIWERLAAHDQAPPSLFSDLFRAVDDHLALPTPVAQFEQIINDSAKARDAFCDLKGSDFMNEMAIVHFLESAHEVISDYGIPGYAELFKLFLREFLRKYNLRYRLDDPFKLRFLLPGSFANLYAELQRINTSNPHLRMLWNDFERSFDRYLRSREESDLKVCIANASKYAEGLAGTTCGNNNLSLGVLCDRLKDWPHESVCSSLKNLYGFCSNYPGIRHAGNPASQLRVLGGKDSVIISVLLLTFTGYLTPDLDAQVLLGS